MEYKQTHLEYKLNQREYEGFKAFLQNRDFDIMELEPLDPNRANSVSIIDNETNDLMQRRCGEVVETFGSYSANDKLLRVIGGSRLERVVAEYQATPQQQ